MGIDQHELEHRNWRPPASKINNEIDRELAEQLDNSIVPNDVESSRPTINAKRVKREKIVQL
jgi:hypothetical protein